jgi:hypothetical protein
MSPINWRGSAERERAPFGIFITRRSGGGTDRAAAFKRAGREDSARQDRLL